MAWDAINYSQLVAGAALGTIMGFLGTRGFNHAIAARQPGRRMRRMMHVLPITNPKTQNTISVRPSIDVFAAGAGVKSKRGYTHSSEAIALQILSNAVHDLPIKLTFEYGTQINEIDSCRIVFGLSRKKSKISNFIFERIAAATKLELIKGEGVHQYFRDQTGAEYRCAHIDDPVFSTRVTRDYGIIYRCVGHSGGALLLCGGIHMFGTQAAVQVALSDEFIDRVIAADCLEFIQLVEVSVLDDGIMIDLDSIRWRDLPFIPVRLKASTATL